MAWFWKALVYLRWGLILSSLATMGWIAYQSYQHPYVETLVDRSAAEIQQAIAVAMSERVDQAFVNTQLETALGQDPIPWSEVRLTEQLAGKYGLSFSDDLATKLEQARAKARSPLTIGAGCLSGVFANQLGDSIESVTCGGLAELTSVGDVKSLVRAADAYASEEPIDRFDLSLGVVGLTLTGATLLSFGSALPATGPAKASVAALKTARRADALSPGLTRYLSKRLAHVVDLDEALRLIRLESKAGFFTPGASLTTRIQRVFRSTVDRKAMTQLADELGELGASMQRAGTGNALYLLRHMDSGQDLARFSRLSKVMGKDTALAFRVFGRGTFRFFTRISKAGVRVGRALRALLLQGWALLASLVLSFLKALSGTLLRVARPRP